MDKTNRRALLSMAVFSLVMVCTATGKIIYVDADAAGANSGTSWDDAYTHLQDGLADANATVNEPLEIRVAQGIYKPDQGLGITASDQTVSFRIKMGWKVKGGYAGVGHPNPDARDVAVYQTILSGDLAGNDVVDVDDPCDLLTHPSRADNSYHVIVAADCDYTTLIDGFTITAGNANGPALANQSGGGVYEGKPNINNCRITYNAAYYLGGGIRLHYGYSDEGSLITNSTIANNAAGTGGGIYGCIRMVNCVINANSATRYGAGGIYLSQGCDTTITDCIISNNSSVTGAGGVYLGVSDSAPIFTRCLFIGNTTNGKGGALAIDGCTCGSSPEFYQCRIIGNSAGGSGGGIVTYGYSYTELHSCLLIGNTAGADGGAVCDGYWGYDDGGSLIVNCTFAHNTAGSAGGAIRYGEYTRRNRALTNSILWYNSDSSGQTGDCSQICIDAEYPPVVNYCCIQVLPAGIGGSGNTEADPLFADPDGADNVAGNEDDDLHLLAGSPCIDAGNNAAVNHDTDLDGNARILGGSVDMGAYELQPPPPGVLYVDDNAPNDPGPGDPTVSDPLEDGTRPHPFDAVQEAIDIAGHGDTIIVLDGSYTGIGNRDIDFQGKAITVRSENGPENCIIDPRGTDTQPRRAFHFHSNETAASVLKGFTMTNGYASSGGAIYCGGTSSPTLTNCIIAGNFAEDEGGGLYNLSGSPTVTNCIFTKNIAAQDGGGMQNDNGSPTVIGCTFLRNLAGDEGGGLCNEDTLTPLLGPVLANCIFVANLAYDGGGLCNDISSPTLINCTFSGNAATHGGAIHNEHGAGPTLTDCILWADTPDEIHNEEGTPTVRYSDIQGGWPGEGNLDLDPYFARSAHWDANGTPNDPRDDFGNAGDYHLKSQAGRWEPSGQTWVQDPVTSSCIDAGDPMSPIGAEPFPNGGVTNMGAHGATTEASKSYFGRPICQTVLAGDLNGDCRVDFEDVRLMGLHWLEKNR